MGTQTNGDSTKNGEATGRTTRCLAFGFAVGVVVIAVPVVSARQVEQPRSSHVHALDVAARDLLSVAIARSPTVGQLCSQLDESDVIVGVQTTMFEVPGTGELGWLAAAGGWRHVRIRIERRASVEDRIAWLGHELWHAQEIASNPGVRDAAALQALYTRIGRTIVAGRYETTAATDVTLVVRKEAASASGRPMTPPAAFLASARPPLGHGAQAGVFSPETWPDLAILLALAPSR